ncbi:hypothetical protein SLA2020_322280 [Shorea laevis]
MDDHPDTIIEHREELMVSPTGGCPTLRTAYFLNPSASIDGHVLELPSSLSNSTKPSTSAVQRHMKVQLKGWRRPSQQWNQWVQSLRPMYQSLWKQAGIYEAIMGSTYEIKQHRELILGVAERWSPETNTFIFPWGEATITLEDVMICGGYSVLGSSFSSPRKGKNLVAIEEKLIEARKEAVTMGAKVASHKSWMGYFMGTRHELEHEAFLSLWLSRFVLVSSSYYEYIVQHAFPIAIRLARGTRFAIAPVVLSSIYRDLGFLKNGFFGSNEMNYDGLLAVYAPFQLLQLWIWERLPELRPIPNPISIDEPRLARWHGLRIENVGDVGLALDLAGESFQWRPYGMAVKNWDFPKFYVDEEQWIPVECQLDEQFISFSRFLRVGELVGMGCIEQYLPHRVAMQFGFDQDLPGIFARCNANPRIAWRNYNRPINDAKLYIPPRLHESDVSTRYLDWWKRSNSVQYGAIKSYVRRRRSSVRFQDNSVVKKEDDSLSIPPGFTLKHKFFANAIKGNKICRTTDVGVQSSNSYAEAGKRMVPVIKQETEELSIPPGFGHKILANAGNGNNICRTMSVAIQTSNLYDEAVRKMVPVIKQEAEELSIPPGFSLKHKFLENGSKESNTDATVDVTVQTSNSYDAAVQEMEPLYKLETEEMEMESGFKNGGESSSYALLRSCRNRARSLDFQVRKSSC